MVDDIFHNSEELKNTYYHHYRLVHTQQNNEQIEGLELIFIELPKFKAQNFTDKRLQTLWLRFLTEIDESTHQIPQDLQEIQEIKEALECVKKAAFSQEEMLYYDQYWDAIRIEKAALDEVKAKNLILQKEWEEERRQKTDSLTKLARKMKAYGESFDEISRETGLSEDDIDVL